MDLERDRPLISVSLRRNQGFERGASIDIFLFRFVLLHWLFIEQIVFHVIRGGKNADICPVFFSHLFLALFSPSVVVLFHSKFLVLSDRTDSRSSFPLISPPIRSTSFLVFSRSVFELFPLSPRYPRNLIFLLFFVSSSFSPTPFKLCFLANSDRDKADFKSRGIEFPDDAGLRLFL